MDERLLPGLTKKRWKVLCEAYLVSELIGTPGEIPTPILSLLCAWMLDTDVWRAFKRLRATGCLRIAEDDTSYFVRIPDEELSSLEGTLDDVYFPEQAAVNLAGQWKAGVRQLTREHAYRRPRPKRAPKLTLAPPLPRIVTPATATSPKNRFRVTEDIRNEILRNHALLESLNNGQPLPEWTSLQVFEHSIQGRVHARGVRQRMKNLGLMAPFHEGRYGRGCQWLITERATELLGDLEPNLTDEEGLALIEQGYVHDSQSRRHKQLFCGLF